MIQKTQKVDYVRELQVTGGGPNADWQTNETLAATTHGITQLCIDVALMSGGDSAKSLPVNEESTSLWLYVMDILQIKFDFIPWITLLIQYSVSLLLEQHVAYVWPREWIFDSAYHTT
jgi:hypothetical protein